jgi:hypothetical protein
MTPAAFVAFGLFILAVVPQFLRGAALTTV